jgi:hypothetical protein
MRLKIPEALVANTSYRNGVALKKRDSFAF